uniref:RNA-dependent RNA polymerase n=1 Tax=Angiostrongylus cantonensis TaxID=6313 RepID=A0A0K0CZ04_ANGCA
MRTSKTSLRLITMTVRKYLSEGVFVAGRDFGYLGSSNSQMRDSGAYFLEKYSRAQYLEYSRLSGTNPPITWQPKIDGAREMLGRFTQIESVPKLMARLGQCFTQTRFRFRGMKGVVVVDPILDEISLWAKRFNIEPPKVKFGSWDVKLVFRPSQIKFKAMRTSSDSLEVVKFSSPIPVSLNKPFIAILDQVSEMQSYECHSRITNRIEQLLDDQLRGMARSILREHNCRSKLKELPQRIDISVLSALAGFQLSTEPFFRSLIKASIKFTITKLMHKQQIQIPPDKGRTMFGVVDETGQLQYEQVFVQYTANITLKMPPPTASRKVLNGKVLLTKNPCIVAGDVRVFTAVDIPALHHLCDVVVFPMHGPRPHPDEMAGSDLDGDEYAVIWDEDLMLDHNEKPFDYTAEKPEYESVNEETLVVAHTFIVILVCDIFYDLQKTDMVDFFVKHITQDSIGMISTSYLFQEDLYGINSEDTGSFCPIARSSTHFTLRIGDLNVYQVCQRLAVKISKAVDFAKTGLPPDPLVRKWTIGILQFLLFPGACFKYSRCCADQDSGKEIPPEKNERRPDFHGSNDFDPIYRSPRLLGRIYREFKAIEDVLRVSEDIGEQEEIECDKCLTVDGWLEYKEKAETELAKYNGRLRAFMENYGIKTEGEIFSGCISEMRNRISDRDQDDMSLYNTTEIIERKVTSLFRDFREEFFKEFGGWESCTEKSSKSFALEESVFYRTANKPTLKMQQKAVAYYRICYERAQQTRDRMLSFAWIAYDILAVVRQENALKEIDSIQFTTPLYEMLRKRISDYCGGNKAKFHSFSQFINQEACNQLRLYTARYPGLDCVMFIVSEWAERNGLFNVRLKCHHLCLIVILYATGRIAGSTDINKPFLEKLEDSPLLEGLPEKINDECQIELLVTFFEYLASRAFRKLRHISFSVLGYASVFLRGEWLPLHEAAVRTYYNMVFNLQFDELNENRPSDPLRSLIIRECEPFVIELPGTVCSPTLYNRVRSISWNFTFKSKTKSYFS